MSDEDVDEVVAVVEDVLLDVVCEEVELDVVVGLANADVRLVKIDWTSERTESRLICASEPVTSTEYNTTWHILMLADQ